MNLFRIKIMKTSNIERFGGLIKEEPLSCIENDILLKDTCVLESVSPFFGYYDEIGAETRPLYLYLMLNEHYSVEEILRKVAQIKKVAGFEFDAVHAEITIPGYPPNDAIRVRDLASYDQIAKLQSLMVEAGIHFKKKIHKVDHVMGHIKLEKFFFLEEVGEGMYFDLQQLHHGYFEIPKNIDWKAFCELTKEVKYDTNLLFFDACTTYFFKDNKLVDLVRIYKEHLDKNGLIPIKERYLKLFSNYAV
jgi:hypothetical protein